MNLAEAKTLNSGDKFRGNGKGGVSPDETFVVVRRSGGLDKHFNRFIPAVTEAEFTDVDQEETHLFLPEEMAAY